MSEKLNKVSIQAVDARESPVMKHIHLKPSVFQIHTPSVKFNQMDRFHPVEKIWAAITAAGFVEIDDDPGLYFLHSRTQVSNSLLSGYESGDGDRDGGGWGYEEPQQDQGQGDGQDGSNQ